MCKSFPLYYEILGQCHDPCIILIAGIGGQLTEWPLPLTHGLANNGFFVVTFDNRDCGLSRYYNELDTPSFDEMAVAKQQGQLFNPPYTLQEMATDVIALMDKLCIPKAYIVGASMGGIIAQYVALNYTDRVLGLTCIATTSGDPSLPSPKKEVLDFFAVSQNAENQSLEIAINNKLQLFKIYNHPDYFNEEKVRSQIISSFKRAYNPDGFKRLMLAMICAQPRAEQLKKLSLPCLVIHGDYDPVFSIEHGQHLADSIPNSHLVVLKKMGHGLPDYFAYKIVPLIVSYFNR